MGVAEDAVEFLGMSVEEATTLAHHIERSYSEPQRYYHTLAHIQHLTQLMRSMLSDIEDVRVFYLSILFHDVVYDPLSNKNEENSVILFEQLVETTYHIFQSVQSKVSQCIIATKLHLSSTGSSDLKLFLDADMSILGADPNTYARYAADIRREYQHIEKEVYCRERAKFLRVFLSRPIYHTSAFLSMYEDQAKRNIEWECCKLESGKLVGKPLHLNMIEFNTSRVEEAVQVCISREYGVICMSVCIQGDIASNMLSTPSCTPTRRDSLWESTCFELFLAEQGSAAYWEVNVSPEGCWNMYHFTEYRKNMSTEWKMHAVTLTILEARANVYTGEVSIDLSGVLPPDSLGKDLEASVALVLRHADGSLKYLAHTHCATVPDFHCRKSFTIRL